jgi:RHS repeat-associated protein
LVGWEDGSCWFLGEIRFSPVRRPIRTVWILTDDPTERLATALTKGSTSSPQWGLSWTYDRYGNRTAQTPTAGSAPMNSLSFANPGGAQTNHADNYSYDASGNMTYDGENTLVYDAENRVTSSSGSPGSGTYSYDGNSLRVKKVANVTNTTVYIFSGTKVVAEYVNGAAPSSPSTEYVYAGGSMLAKIQSGAITYYHRDHLSNRLVTNSTGGIAEQLGTYPFGESSYNATNEKWLFTTYERDAESLNDYAMARTYINRFGRFSASDQMSGAVADPQSLNHYSYVDNDPINTADPSGMMMINMTGWILGLDGGWDTFDDSNEFDFLAHYVGSAELYSSSNPDYNPWDYSEEQIQGQVAEGGLQDQGPVALYQNVLITGDGSGGGGIGGTGSTGVNKLKLLLLAVSDCLGGIGREITYSLMSEGDNGTLTDAKDYTVTETIAPRNSSQPVNLLTGNTTSQKPQDNGFSGFTDSIGGLANQDNLQTFTAAPVSGGSSTSVFVRDMDGNDYGTNGIFTSNGQVYVNGTTASQPCPKN